MDNFGIARYSRGYFVTTDGNYDASVLDTEDEGVWLLPIDDEQVMFVSFEDISSYKRDAYGSYDLDEAIRKFYYENQ